MRLVILYEQNQHSGLGHYARMKVLYSACQSSSLFSEVVFEERANADFDSLECDVVVCDYRDYSDLISKEIDFITSKRVSVSMEAYSNESLFTVNHFIYNKNGSNEENLENLKNALIDPRFCLESSNVGDNIDQGIISLGGTATASHYYDVVLSLRTFNEDTSLIILSPVQLETDDILGVPVLVNDKNYLDYIRSCSFAVVAPGMTMLEILKIKKKLYLIPLSVDHNRFINFLDSESIAFPISSYGESRTLRHIALHEGVNRLIEKLV